MPNPETTPCLVTGKGVLTIYEAGTAFVYDSKGVLRVQKTFGANQTRIDVSKLSGGVYLVKFVNAPGNGRTSFLRFTYWK